MRTAIAMVSLAAALASGCGTSPTSPTSPASPPAASAATYPVTTMSFTSDAQDWVGQGRSQTFTLQNAVFAANVYNNGNYLSIVIRPSATPPTVWTLILDAPGGNPIAPGTSASSARTVQFSGDGRGCSVITGRIVIHAFEFNRENQAIKTFRASFEQRCEFKEAALRGEIAILADPWR